MAADAPSNAGPTLVLGDDPVARRVAQFLRDEPGLLARIEGAAEVGFVVDDVRAGRVEATAAAWAMAGVDPPREPVSWETIAAQILPPGERARSFTRRAAALKKAAPYEFQMSVGAPGAQRLLWVENVPRRDPQGACYGFLGIVRDVTEIRRAQKEIARRDALLGRAQRLARFGHFFHDLTTDQLFWSDELAMLFGMPQDAAPARHRERMAAVLAPGELARLIAVRDAAFSNGRASFSITLTGRRIDDGAARTIFKDAAVDYNEHGDAVAVYGIIQDVTARIQAERDARDREQLLQTAQSIGQMGQWRIDLDTMTATTSPALRAIYGAPPDEPETVPLSFLHERIVEPDERGRVDPIRADAIRKGEPYVLESRLMRIDGGEPRIVRTYGLPGRDADGRVDHYVGFVQDVTEEVRARHERERLERALQTAQNAETLNFFAGGLAHEVSNMLQPAFTFMALAKSAGEACDASAASAHLDQALHAMRRAADVARRALDFVNVDSASVGAVRLASVLSEARPLIDAAAAKVTWSLPADPTERHVAADATGLIQVLLNLVQNAVDAGGDGVGVAISAERVDVVAPDAERLEIPAGCYVRMRVVDDGPGFSDSDRARAFEPLFTTKAPGRGTGLGLPVARTLVRRWGGDVILEANHPDAGPGAAFAIYLPIVNPATNVDPDAAVTAGR